MIESYHANSGTSTRTYTFSQKWGDDPFTALGFAQIPTALIDYAAQIGLVPEECWLIVCLLKFKHTPAAPYPSQERLATLIGQSSATVRRLLKRIVRKGLMAVERVRGDLGHYTHSVYDFTPLRAALNECYYQDHPQERPAALKPTKPQATAQKTTVQKCTVATTVQKAPQPPRKISRNYRAKSALTTVQNCTLNKSPKEKEKEESEDEDFSPAAMSAPQPPLLGEQKEPSQKACQKDDWQEIYRRGMAQVRAAYAAAEKQHQERHTLRLAATP